MIKPQKKNKKKGTKKKQRINWKTRSNMAINTYVSIITLNVKGQNAPIKKHRAFLLAQWLRICLPTQGKRVRALVWEDPTCRGATRPVSHNY